MTPVLEVGRLCVRLPTPDGPATVVDGIDYRVEAGEVFGIAGESGSGKTMSVLALMGLLPQGAAVEGRAVFEGQDLLRLPPGQLRRICGRDLAMVFQDPMTSLHPMLSIGTQLTEHVRLHLGLGRRAAAELAVEALREVRIPDPERAPGLPAPVLRRDATTDRHRCRARVPAEAPRRRRADDRARRHGPGRDHPTARPPSEGVGVDDRPHHARPRRPLVDRGPGRGLLRRSRGGGGEPDRGAGPPPDTRTRAGSWTRCPTRKRRRHRSSRSMARHPRRVAFPPAARSIRAAGTRAHRAARRSRRSCR